MWQGLLRSLPTLLAGAGLVFALPAAAPAGADETAAPVGTPAPAIAPIFRYQDNAWDDTRPTEHDNAFDEDLPCPRRHANVYMDGSYLLWFIQATKVPYLLTTSASGTGTGVLFNNGDTELLAGNGKLIKDERHGAKITLGWWLEDYLEHPVGVELTGFVLAQRSAIFTANSPNGSAVLSRPLIDATPPVGETAYFVSYPQQFSGRMSIWSKDQFYGGELNAIWAPPAGVGGLTPEWIFGVRSAYMQESVDIGQFSTVLVNGFAAFPGIGPVPTGSSLQIFDLFGTRNVFYGAQAGGRVSTECGRFTFELVGKLAVGVTEQTASIAGTTTLVQTGITPQTVQGGVLALSTNIGHYTQDKFSILPELGLNIAFKLNHHIDLELGYSCIYWSSVMRAGDLINRTINPNYLPTSTQFGQGTGPAQPAPILKDTEFWAHGLNAGFVLHY